jgi:hypothetical protein
MRTLAVAAVAALCVFMWLTTLTRNGRDDWSLVVPARRHGLIGGLLCSYTHFTGRFTWMALIQAVGCFAPARVWILTPVLNLLFVVSSVLFFRSVLGLKWSASVAAGILTLLAGTVLVPSYAVNFIWTSAVSNYLTGVILGLFAAILLFKKRLGRAERFAPGILFVLCFLACGCNEMVTATLLVLLSAAALHRSLRGQGLAAGGIGAIVGTAIMLASPGNRLRRIGEDPHPLPMAHIPGLAAGNVITYVQQAWATCTDVPGLAWLYYLQFPDPWLYISHLRGSWNGLAPIVVFALVIIGSAHDQETDLFNCLRSAVFVGLATLFLLFVQAAISDYSIGYAWKSWSYSPPALTLLFGGAVISHFLGKSLRIWCCQVRGDMRSIVTVLAVCFVAVSLASLCSLARTYSTDAMLADKFRLEQDWSIPVCVSRVRVGEKAALVHAVEAWYMPNDNKRQLQDLDEAYDLGVNPNLVTFKPSNYADEERGF